jgi:glycosyltransferase involved in cell wall biosynthesis
MVDNSGIGVYIRYYILAILKENVFKVTLLGRKDKLNLHFNAYKDWELVDVAHPIYSITEQIILPFLIPRCDVFWSPHYNIPIFHIGSSKHLVTIPDVYHLAFFNTLTLPQKLYAKVVMNMAAFKASKITTISNYSKNEIIRFTKTSPSKVDVIYLGVDNALFKHIDNQTERQRVRDTYKLPIKYILFVGNVKPNKNLKKLVEAFSKIVHKISDIKLVIIGKQEGFITGDPLLFEFINCDTTLRERIVFTGFVENKDLPVIYSLAHLFAFPSIYEGFGFPPLEAMACNCPVVASTATSIPEICGNAAFYVDPDSVEDISNGLYAVATDVDLRKKLVKLGGEQYKLYNWSVSSRQFMHELYQLVS